MGRGCLDQAEDVFELEEVRPGLLAPRKVFAIAPSHKKSEIPR